MKSKTQILAAIFLIAAMWTKGQPAPEALMGSCPPLPSEEELIAYGIISIWNHAEEFKSKADKVEAFKDKIADAKKATKKTGNFDEAYRKEMEKNRAKMEAEVKNLTGKSVAEIEKMSEAEKREMGMKAADKKLNSTLGMSLAELQALEGKSEEEILAALEKSGAMDRMMQQGMQQANSPTAKKEQQTTMRKVELTNEMNDLQMQIVEKCSRMKSQMDTLRERHKALWEGQYSLKVKPMITDWMSLSTSEGSLEVQEAKGLEPKIVALLTEYFGKIAPQWRAQIVANMDALKQLDPQCQRIDGIYKELGTLDGLDAPAFTAKSGYESWYLAVDYLEMASQCPNLYGINK